jgi:SAM-dependent methyltransferase
MVRSGIPTVRELEQLKQTDAYRRHTDFNNRFLARHGNALARYGRHWGADPFKLWSRRWEYPYAASQLINFAERRAGSRGAGGELRVLDAGSGVTYFPYFLCAQLPQSAVTCVDYDQTYASMFDAINAAEDAARVRFVQASLQSLPLESGELDAICCISVLEHTDHYEQILDEFLRVLRPGGLLVLTFDLSLDGKFTLPRPQAESLVRALGTKYLIDENVNLLAELDRMHDPGILSSDHVRATEPDLLPWSTPVRVAKAVQDLIRGKGWTTGFRSRTIVCCQATKPQPVDSVSP